MAAPDRRGVRPSRVTAQLLALLLLPAAPALANSAVPLLILVWPAAWLLLPVIIPLEALVAGRILGTDLVRSLKLATRANLISTALGIPVLLGLPGLIIPDQFFGGLASALGVPVSQGHHTAMALASAALFCAPCYLLSVGCEQWVVRRMVEARLQRRVRRWAWTANAVSYMPVFALAALYFQYAVPNWYSKYWQVGCLRNLKAISQSIEEYRRTHDDRLPRASDFAALVPSIRPSLARSVDSSFREEKALRCPATGRSYVFNTALSGVSPASIRRPDEAPLLRDAVPHDQYGYCVLFADETTRACSAAQLGAMKGTFK
jgi:hypothetical protein